MSEQWEKIAMILINNHNEPLTPQEAQELKEWLSVAKNNRYFFNELHDKNVLKQELSKFDPAAKQAGWKNIRQKISLYLDTISLVAQGTKHSPAG
jgi:hypothetical protein